MNLADANKQITKIEQNTNIDKIKIKELNGWPIVRTVLYSILAEKGIKPEKPSSRSFTSHQIRRQIIISCAHYFSKSRIPKRSKLNSDTEVVFLCRASHQVSIKGHTAKFDRVLDPLFNELNKNKQCQMYVLGIPKYKEYFFPKRHLARFGRFPAMEISGIVESGLKKELDSWQIDTNKFDESISRAEKDFSAGYFCAKKLFKENTKMEFLFTSVWYAAETMGYIAAAREIGIKVVEVQHAAEIYNHVMYFDWTKTPDGGYELTPDRFMMWNDESSEIVNKSFAGGRKNTSVSIGYPWHDFYKFYGRVEIPPTSPPEFLKRVLFTLQTPTFESKKRVPEFIIEYMQRDHSDVHFNFRCHPNDLNAQQEIKDLNRFNLKTKFEVTSGSEDLIESLSRCNYHITAYSTVCYEAQIYGIPTLLFGSESAEHYRREIDEGVFQWTEGDAGSLAQFLGSDHRIPEPKQKLVSSLELLKQGLEEVMFSKP